MREAEISAKDVCKTIDAEEKYRNSKKAKTSSTKKRRTTTAGGQKPKVSDAWILAGAPTAAKFTWDTLKNDNLDMGQMDFRPRSRYDRVFVLAPDDISVKVKSFELVGKERLSCGKFPSDHYGVLVDFEVSNAGAEK